MHNFRTYDLAVDFYKTIKKYPLPYYLKNQFERAASSIALNLAEGSGKATARDQKRFYQIALGSLRECQSVIDLAEIKNQKIVNTADYLGACLYKLCQRG